jgi:hypothetical protein
VHVLVIEQEVWSGTKRMYGTFLHSPLLDELKSLETVLMREAARRRKQLARSSSERSSQGFLGKPSPIVLPGCGQEVELSVGRMSLPMLPSIAGGGGAVLYHEKGCGEGVSFKRTSIDVLAPGVASSPSTVLCRLGYCCASSLCILQTVLAGMGHSWLVLSLDHHPEISPRDSQSKIVWFHVAH